MSIILLTTTQARQTVYPLLLRIILRHTRRAVSLQLHSSLMTMLSKEHPTMDPAHSNPLMYHLQGLHYKAFSHGRIPIIIKPLLPLHCPLPYLIQNAMIQRDIYDCTFEKIEVVRSNVQIAVVSSP